MRSFVIAILALAVAWSASGTAVAAVTDPDGLIVRFEPGVSAAERAAIRDEAGTGLENTGQAIQGTAGSIDADTDAGDAWDAGIGGGGAVAVIDSGVDLAHPDLAANAWRNPGESGAGRESNGLDDDLNGKVDDWRGWDFVAGDSDPADENGHGTHVAGTIAALRGNGIGVAGVADGSRLMALRVLNAQGTGSVAGGIPGHGHPGRAGPRWPRRTCPAPRPSCGPPPRARRRRRSSRP